MLLAGDIGGTKTNLAVYQSRDQLHEPLTVAKYPSAAYPSLEALVQEFLAAHDLPAIDRASFGVAGPVVDGQAEITNLPWKIEVRNLRSALGIPVVKLLNDLAAIATAIPLLEAQDRHVLNAGRAVPGGSLAVIAPGTGLGEAFLSWNGSRYVPHSSEGGHGDFGPSTREQIDLLYYLQERYGHVSWERVCSGIGIPNIYQFLKHSKYAPEPVWLAEKLADASVDPTPLIATAALRAQTGDELCVKTLSMFVSILGAEAGNLALTVVATGGVYIAGGIPPRVIPALQDPSFMHAFRKKGRLSDVLANIPVYVVTNRTVALLGAAAYGLVD
jgi:glucokinase